MMRSVIRFIATLKAMESSLSKNITKINRSGLKNSEGPSRTHLVKASILKQR